MKYTRLVLILLALAQLNVVFAQEEPKEDDAKLENVEQKDYTRRTMFNEARGSAEGNLINGGSYYVSNPSPTYKVDVKKAYHNPEWQDAEVRMVNGDYYKAKVRYRVIDQAFEIQHEGEAYELKKDQLQGVYIGQDRFVMMPDPLLKKRGAHIYQLHYSSPKYQLVEFHGAQWQDPPKQNMFDTSDQHRTIKSMKQLIIRTASGFHLLKSPKDLINALGLDKKSPQAKYAKKQQLKLNKAADVVAFLKYLEQ